MCNPAYNFENLEEQPHLVYHGRFVYRVQGLNDLHLDGFEIVGGVGTRYGTSFHGDWGWTGVLEEIKVKNIYLSNLCYFLMTNVTSPRQCYVQIMIKKTSYPAV